MRKDRFFTTPILLVIFNRPETERKVFEQIRKIKPKYLYVVADGPRKNKIDDLRKCKEARKIIDEGIDWSCKVKKLYRKENLGCKMGVSGAIDWFFENVEEGIILEDDCVPNLSFFNFCKLLLKKYRNNNRIMHISGDNFLTDKVDIDGDYYFSRFSHVWGWATWKRAWKKYNVNMISYPEFVKENGFRKIWKEFEIRRYWKILFNKTYKGLIDTWDYQWLYSIWKNKGLCICPRFNLVINIGFGNASTHTFSEGRLKNQSMKNIVVKNHPPKMEWNNKADKFVYKTLFYSTFVERLKDFFNRL